MRRKTLLAVLFACAGAVPGCDIGDAAGPETLRVCADPNNLPFSNREREGLENRLVDLVAADLGLSVDYTWRAQRRGFLRETLNAGRCDVVPGIASDVDAARTTRPYYESSYVFIWPRESDLDLRAWDDPRLRELTVGVTLIGDDYVNTPPAHVLADLGIIDNVVGFTVYGDYRRDSPPTAILDALEEGTIDVAVPWGPLAGWLDARRPGKYVVRPVPDAPRPHVHPMRYAVSMGVRRDDEALAARLDDVLERRRAEVERILDEYRIPASAPAEESARR